jgi:ribosomal-protein-alanine N-acetyltransferase
MLFAHNRHVPSDTPPVQMQTERLSLTLVTLTDVPQLIVLLQDQQLISASKGCQMPLSTNQLIAWLFSQQNAYRKGRGCCYSVRFLQRTDLLGLVMIDATHADREELSYFLRPDYWRQGIMGEAAATVLHMWQPYQRHPMIAQCHKENPASRGLLQHLGLRLIPKTDDGQDPFLEFILPLHSQP